MNYDFSRLTNAQAWLIVLQGWRIGQKYPDGTPFPRPGKSTVRKLIERGLVVEREVRVQTPVGVLTVIEYDVPLHVHAAYCLSCPDHEDDSADAVEPAVGES